MPMRENTKVGSNAEADAANNEKKVLCLYARCFGNFELFCRGEPVLFGRRQTKELVAFLIDRKEAIVSAEEVAAALWEDSNDLISMKHRIRNLVADLQKTFAALGYQEIIIRGRNCIGLRMDRIECDYYRYLSGTARPQEQFRGEYMEQYSWAENTKGALVFGTR